MTIGLNGLVNNFMTAAKALGSSITTGVTGTGMQKLDFKANGKTFTAIQQNPNRFSGASKLAREGHKVVQIRDNDENILRGHIDLTDNSFTPYNAGTNPVEISEIEAALRSAPNP